MPEDRRFLGELARKRLRSVDSMSVNGTKRTSRDARLLVRFRREADMSRPRVAYPSDANDPKPTSGVQVLNPKALTSSFRPCIGFQITTRRAAKCAHRESPKKSPPHPCRGSCKKNFRPGEQSPFLHLRPALRTTHHIQIGHGSALSCMSHTTFPRRLILGTIEYQSRALLPRLGVRGLACLCP
jgi:hypothetical protein